MLLKGDKKDKALWKLGRVVSKISGKHGIVHCLKLKQRKRYVVEQPVQLVGDLEIGGKDPHWKPNPEAVLLMKSEERC